MKSEKKNPYKHGPVFLGKTLGYANGYRFPGL